MHSLALSFSPLIAVCLILPVPCLSTIPSPIHRAAPHAPAHAIVPSPLTPSTNRVLSPFPLPLLFLLQKELHLHRCRLKKSSPGFIARRRIEPPGPPPIETTAPLN